jgi:hypothetical protein
VTRVLVTPGRTSLAEAITLVMPGAMVPLGRGCAGTLQPVEGGKGSCIHLVDLTEDRPRLAADHPREGTEVAQLVPGLGPRLGHDEASSGYGEEPMVRLTVEQRPVDKYTGCCPGWLLRLFRLPDTSLPAGAAASAARHIAS